MNKAELKSFAIFARRDLIEKVSLRAKLFGIDKKNRFKIEEKFGKLYVNGQDYPANMKSAFLALENELKVKGYEQLIEEVAYTWFNRIIAIRYMEVNGYLPERVNVLSSSTGKLEPDILKNYETMEINVNLLEVRNLIRQGNIEEAYRKLFVAQCNELNKILPFLFERINDYTELLLPNHLLDSESIIRRLISNEEITDSFTEVESIGWLYQYYISEKKDEVFAGLKQNKKITKENIPAATQLFTPSWVVQYMVENSLGHVWLDRHPGSSLRKQMEYYIEPSKQISEVQIKLDTLRIKDFVLTDIKLIDPACGSGHILVYAFELLYSMYEEAGYAKNDIPTLILANNLYGIDVDDRAAQLTSFALMMKARSKTRSFFRSKTFPNIIAIQESNDIDQDSVSKLIYPEDSRKSEILKGLLEFYVDAKNYGSLLQPPKFIVEETLQKIETIQQDVVPSLLDVFAFESLEKVKQILKQTEVLGNQYNVVITNPPYMGVKGMNSKLSEFMKKYYINSKADASTAFMERSLNMAKINGYISMINIPSWMFLTSFESLREKLLTETTFQSLLHLGRGIFGSDFGTVAFVINRTNIENYIGVYRRLFDKQGAVDSIDSKKHKFFEKNRDYILDQGEFRSIPKSPLAYWASKQVRKIFKTNKRLNEIAELKVGLQTGDNGLFLRFWHEVEYNKIGLNLYNFDNNSKWIPFNKGGPYRKWYGNQEYVVNWEENGKEIREHRGAVIRNEKYYFKKGITWSDVTSGAFSSRFIDNGFIFDTTGPTLFTDPDLVEYIIGYFNSNVFQLFLSYTMSGIHYNAGSIGFIPFIYETKPSVKKLVNECIDITYKDWNLMETSWRFLTHPFLSYQSKTKFLYEAFTFFEENCKSQYLKIKYNEEELNRIFINIYGLQDELVPDVLTDDISLHKADQVSESKSFLSYFIGCLVGRYSLDKEGIVYAGDIWDDNKYKSFKPNKYGLILLTDEQYFEHDIIARLREFLSVTFGQETAEENIQWLAESLELKRNESAEDRLRRYFLDEFYKDHLQTYQKRPIYWLVDSGKQKGLRTLIYMHRYQPDTMATIRFEHLQEIQAKYNNEINTIDIRLVNPNLSATEKRELEKKKTMYQKRLDELMEFDKDLATYANAQISIDLDDGVAVNYAKFTKVLAPLK